MTHSAPFIVGTDLGKTFGYGHAAIHALREVNIEIHRGDFTVVVGPSGSGKVPYSTLLAEWTPPQRGPSLWETVT